MKRTIDVFNLFIWLPTCIVLCMTGHLNWIVLCAIWTSQINFKLTFKEV